MSKEKVVPKAKRIKLLNDKCWEAMSLFTRLKHANARGFANCVTCGKPTHYTKGNAGHFIHNHLDYDEINVNEQCRRCNKWLHGNLINYYNYLLLKYGKEKLDNLIQRGKAKQEYTEEELQKILIELTKKLESVKNGTYIC